MSGCLPLCATTHAPGCPNSDIPTPYQTMNPMTSILALVDVCSCCELSFPKDSLIPVKLGDETYLLDLVCSSTYIPNMMAYPEQHNSDMILLGRALCTIGNLILKNGAPPNG